MLLIQTKNTKQAKTLTESEPVFHYWHMRCTSLFYKLLLILSHLLDYVFKKTTKKRKICISIDSTYDIWKTFFLLFLINDRIHTFGFLLSRILINLYALCVRLIYRISRSKLSFIHNCLSSLVMSWDNLFIHVCFKRRYNK
jgi:hypothetical protein